MCVNWSKSRILSKQGGCGCCIGRTIVSLFLCIGGEAFTSHPYCKLHFSVKEELGTKYRTQNAEEFRPSADRSKELAHVKHILHTFTSRSGARWLHSLSKQLPIVCLLLSVVLGSVKTNKQKSHKAHILMGKPENK